MYAFEFVAIVTLIVARLKQLKQFETVLFPQDMIQDIYKLHWNIIHKWARAI